MSSSLSLRLAAAGLLCIAATGWAQPISGIGRAATPKEVAAWDIDVRPDFKGLPAGAGSVAQGMVLWEAQCANCHGVFGESNAVFAPLVGGTTKDDVRSGRTARLLDPAFPGRTTLMKLSTVSTLWDYIQRAMPWNAPKTLKPDEVYALTAFLLNLGGVVADDFTLSNQNIAEVQQRLPNRNGMSTDHGLWPGKGFGNGGKADVGSSACMTDCGPQPSVRSSIPDFARNAHGNLAEQNRLVGAQVGADTRPQGPTGTVAAAPSAAVAAPTEPGGTPKALANTAGCLVCHGVDNKVVGPALRDVATRYAGRADAADYLVQRIQAGGSGVWGPVPMPAQAVSAADARTLALWITGGLKP
jgi:cytochrome c551/c552